MQKVEKIVFWSLAVFCILFDVLEWNELLYYTKPFFFLSIFYFYSKNNELKNLFFYLLMCFFAIGEVSKLFFDTINEEVYIVYYSIPNFLLTSYFFWLIPESKKLKRKDFNDSGLYLITFFISVSSIVLISSYEKNSVLEYATHYFYAFSFLILSGILYIYFNNNYLKVRFPIVLSLISIVLYDLFFAINTHVFESLAFKLIYLFARYFFYYNLLLFFIKSNKQRIRDEE